MNNSMPQSDEAAAGGTGSNTTGPNNSVGEPAGGGQLPPAEPRIEEFGPIHIVGLGKQFTAQTRTQIPLLWQRFARWIGQVPHQGSQRTYGVIRNSDKGHGFYYMAGVDVTATTAVPDGLGVVSLPLQRYAVFTHAGHVSKLFDTMCDIYGRWLPEAKVELCDAPCFELYGEDFNPETGLGLIEVWIPIEPDSTQDD